MNKTRRITLIVAAIVAIGTGILTVNYLGGLQQKAAPQQAPRTILVAGQDIPARTKITREMVVQSSRPANEVDPDAVLDPRQLDGKLAMITIPTGSTITTSKIGAPVETSLTYRLRPGTRAVSISIDKVKSVSGLIQAGDKVDVIAVPPRDSSSQPRGYAILRGITVLALGNSLETAGATPSPENQNYQTITLELTPEQTDMIAMADLNTTLRLALRSPKEPIRSFPVEPLSFPVQQPPHQAAPNVPAPANPAAAPVVRLGVTVIDGDKVQAQ
jgi:pilus assembly protein CpaB